MLAHLAGFRMFALLVFIYDAGFGWFIAVRRTGAVATCYYRPICDRQSASLPHLIASSLLLGCFKSRLQVMMTCSTAAFRMGYVGICKLVIQVSREKVRCTTRNVYKKQISHVLYPTGLKSRYSTGTPPSSSILRSSDSNSVDSGRVLEPLTCRCQ